MAAVVWTERALGHLDAISDYIARDSPRLAQLFVRRVFDATTLLADFPRSGRRVPEFNRDDLREILIQSYRIIYRVTGGSVEVIAVRHAARRLPIAEIDDGN